MQRNCILITIGLALCICRAQAATIRVPADQPTIQAGINAAVNGDTVLVADGIYTGAGNRDIDFMGKAIEVVSENGPEFTIIDCDAIVADYHRGFYFHSDETNLSKLDGFTVINGIHENGAGIYCNNASPLIINCVFEDHMASQKGGAIYCISSSLTLSNCAFSGNSASYGGGAYFFQYGNPVVEECKFLDNIANSYGGGIVCDSSSGTFTECLISGNETIQPNSSGGGIYCDSSSSTITLIRCDVIGNSTASYGGGIHFVRCGNMSTVSLCHFAGNNANFGGGIYFSENVGPIVGGVEQFANSFDNNTAACGVDMCTVPGRSSMINAGYNHFTGYHLSNFYVAPQNSFDLTGCTSSLTPIEQDVYIAPDGDDSNDGLTPDTPFKTLFHAAGHIYGSESNPLTLHLSPGEYSPSATGESIPIQLIDHTIIKGGSAETTIVNGDGTGPVFVGYGVTSTVEALTITGGASKSDGGGIHGLYADMTVTNCIIRDNPAENAAEGGKGGGISAVNSSLNVTNSLIEKNGAYSNGSGVVFLVSGASNDLALTMSGCIVSENYASGDGGGVCVDSYSDSSHLKTVEIENCTIQNNISTSGGGVYINSSGISSFPGLAVYIDNCAFQGNISSHSGGGIHCSLNNINDSLLVIQNSTIENNHLNALAGDNSKGGGLHISSSPDSIIRNCLIKDNFIIAGSIFSQCAGGGIYYSSKKTGIIQSCIIQGNTVAQDSSFMSTCSAGGVYFESEKSGIIENSVIRDNTADDFGGVCYSITSNGSNRTNRIVNCTIVGNTAKETHGGVFIRESLNGSTNEVFDICNTIIRNNSPGQIGMSDSGNLTVRTTFCNVAAGFPGAGNIDQDPRFAGAADLHLRSDSPCIDAGTNRFATNLDCDLNPRLQGGEFDIGAYEYAGWPDQARIYLSMPLHYYQTGDTCSCEAAVWNPGTTTISGHPLFVVLCAYGAYFFAPGFSDFDYFSRDYPPGLTTVTVIPPFAWPDIQGAADNILWIAALTDPGITQTCCPPDFFTFGWY